MRIRVPIVLAILIGVLSPVAAWAQVPITPFHPSSWRDCSAAKCSAADAFVYLLWSRQNDNNDCKYRLDLAGESQLRTACDTLVPTQGLAPIDDRGVVDGLLQLLNSQTNTYPQPWGSSIGGFSFAFDRGSGAPFRSTRSLGPLFIDRPLTSGKGSWSVGVSFLRSNWTQMDGIALDSIRSERGRIPGTSTCTPITCTSLRWSAELHLVTTQVVSSVTYGLSDRLDVALAVPFVGVDVRGTSFLSGEFSDTVPDGQVVDRVSASGRSSGFGDALLLAKYSFADTHGPESARFSLGGVVEIRLPTGDPAKMTGLGSGAVAAKIIGSYAPKDTLDTRVPVPSVNFSVGYTLAGNGVEIENAGRLSDRSGGASSAGSEQYTADFRIAPSDEIQYAVGIDLALNRDVTMTAEYLGRLVRHSATFDVVAFANEEGRIYTQPFLRKRSYMPLSVAALGLKMRLVGGWVGAVHAMAPLSQTGVTAWRLVTGIEHVSSRPAGR